MTIQLDLSEEEEAILAEVIMAYDYKSPEDFVRVALDKHMHSGNYEKDEKIEHLESITSRMFPSGVTPPSTNP